MIVRDGLVAIRRIPARVQIVKVNGTEYLFLIKHNISLCWVKEEDAPAVIAKQVKACCGGGMKAVFHYADDAHVRRWELGGR